MVIIKQPSMNDLLNLVGHKVEVINTRLGISVVGILDYKENLGYRICGDSIIYFHLNVLLQYARLTWIVMEKNQIQIYWDMIV